MLETVSKSFESIQVDWILSSVDQYRIVKRHNWLNSISRDINAPRKLFPIGLMIGN